MDPNVRRRVAIGVTGLAVAAGGGIAYAATQSTPAQERKAFLDDAAHRLNVTPDQLASALKAAAKARVDKAVADGRLTQAQGDEIKQRIDQGGGVPFLGGRPRGFGHDHGPGGGPGGGPFGGLDAAATYLDLTPAQLMTQLRSGKSLADVANARNKDVAGLKSALRDDVRKKLDQAVKDNQLTQAQADEELKELDSRLDDIVNGARPEGRPGPRFRHGGADPGGRRPPGSWF